MKVIICVYTCIWNFGNNPAGKSAIYQYQFALLNCNQCRLPNSDDASVRLMFGVGCWLFIC